MVISESPLVGACPALVELRALVTKLAASMSPVLVTGESGTGKDLVARAIHATSTRAGGPFIVVKCAALTPELVDRELFAESGPFLAATGGTLFLDGIAELPLDVQPKLVRALQERRVRPAGSTRELPFDARVIASTNRDLEILCQQGLFRDDLRFRIQVLTAPVPPLRTRGADVHLLAAYLLARSSSLSSKTFSGFTAEAAAALGGYRWPGNVRELENAIAHAVALAGSERIGLADLPFAIRRSVRRPLVADDDSLVTLEEVERRHVARVLDRVAGNKSAAARVLGIERRTLYRMMERWRD